MTYLGKVLRKFTIQFLIATILILLINILLYGFYIYFLNNSNDQRSVQKVLETTADALVQREDRIFVLEENHRQILEEQDIWGMLLDNSDGRVLWQTRLPEDFPLQYTSTDIAKFSRGYLFDYPVFVWEHPGGLLVLGYPKSSYTKQLSNFQTIKSVKNAPLIVLLLLSVDIILLFWLYYRTELRTIRLLNPFIDGIGRLAKGSTVHLHASEPLNELAEEINSVSRLLQKKDTARANWISGISHDIRTPLSIILGYSDKLANTSSLPKELRQQCSRISEQAVKIRNLVSDLNLASKLEYNMQPLRPETIKITSFLRGITADFLNNDLGENYDITCDLNDLPANIGIRADRSLLYRATENLIHNSILHNPDGCRITLSAGISNHQVEIRVADNGIGVSAEMLHRLQHQPHYMMNDSGTKEIRHGLGLLIVKQILDAHEGHLFFGNDPDGGFVVQMFFPASPSPLA